MKLSRMWLIIGAGLLLLGGILGFNTLSQYWNGRNVPLVSVSPFATASAAPVAPETQFSGIPVRLEIPALNIDLPIVKGYYNTRSKQWTLTLDKVQYATMTPPANNVAGNTFLYGHNRVGVFHTLNRIQLDDEAIVTTDNGHSFHYRFRGALETVPTDDSLFRYQGKPILTIQTCSGVFYQNRQLFTFDLESAQ